MAEPRGEGRKDGPRGKVAGDSGSPPLPVALKAPRALVWGHKLTVAWTRGPEAGLGRAPRPEPPACAPPASLRTSCGAPGSRAAQTDGRQLPPQSDGEGDSHGLRVARGPLTQRPARRAVGRPPPPTWTGFARAGVTAAPSRRDEAMLGLRWGREDGWAVAVAPTRWAHAVTVAGPLPDGQHLLSRQLRLLHGRRGPRASRQAGDETGGGVSRRFRVGGRASRACRENCRELQVPTSPDWAGCRQRATCTWETRAEGGQGRLCPQAGVCGWRTSGRTRSTGPQCGLGRGLTAGARAGGR